MLVRKYRKKLSITIKFELIQTIAYWQAMHLEL